MWIKTQKMVDRDQEVIKSKRLRIYHIGEDPVGKLERN
jgi:hypothetical protein